MLGGERIAYRIEARDRDDVSGVKVGSSRTLYVVIQNAHETLEDRLERQREVLERLMGDLGDRLERGRHGRARRRQVRRPMRRHDVAARVAALATVHDSEESHLALLGRLLDDDRREGNLGKPLRAALAASPIGWRSCCATRRRS